MLSLERCANNQAAVHDFIVAGRTALRKRHHTSKVGCTCDLGHREDVALLDGIGSHQAICLPPQQHPAGGARYTLRACLLQQRDTASRRLCPCVHCLSGMPHHDSGHIDPPSVQHDIQGRNRLRGVEPRGTAVDASGWPQTYFSTEWLLHTVAGFKASYWLPSLLLGCDVKGLLCLPCQCRELKES